MCETWRWASFASHCLAFFWTFTFYMYVVFHVFDLPLWWRERIGVVFLVWFIGVFVRFVISDAYHHASSAEWEPHTVTLLPQAHHT